MRCDAIRKWHPNSLNPVEACVQEKSSHTGAKDQCVYASFTDSQESVLALITLGIVKYSSSDLEGQRGAIGVAHSVFHAL